MMGTLFAVSISLMLSSLRALVSRVSVLFSYTFQSRLFYGFVVDDIIKYITCTMSLYPKISYVAIDRVWTTLSILKVWSVKSP